MKELDIKNPTIRKEINEVFFDSQFKSIIDNFANIEDKEYFNKVLDKTPPLLEILKKVVNDEENIKDHLEELAKKLKEL